ASRHDRPEPAVRPPVSALRTPAIRSDPRVIRRLMLSGSSSGDALTPGLDLAFERPAPGSDFPSRTDASTICDNHVTDDGLPGRRSSREGTGSYRERAVCAGHAVSRLSARGGPEPGATGRED